MPAEALPAPGLGTYGMTDPAVARDTIDRAVAAGYRHVDTAQKYRNEAVVGEAIAAAAIDREDLFLATKVAEANLAPADVARTARRSLARLGVDRVDLLYVHWPWDGYTVPGTLEAFNELHDEGLTRHVGVCNFTPALLDEARAHLDPPLFAHQVEMHPLCPQRELHAYALAHDHHLVAYCPLMRGGVFEVPELCAIAEKHDATPTQVSLAWLLGKENVVPIPKATGAHVEENARAAELSLDPADVATIESIDRTERVLDHPEKGAWNW